MSALIDLTGKRFGRLVVLFQDKTSKIGTKWYCMCDCGNKVSVFSVNLRKGNTNSCGCLQAELTSKRSRIHGDGDGHERLYRIWKAMKERCYYPKNIDYSMYGGRGIFVCDEWKSSYVTFKKWALQNGYEANKTIDRIDVNREYSPSNCRWATPLEQANNTRRNVHITYKGITKTVSEWSKETGINAHTLAGRKRSGWTDEECIEIPASIGNNQKTRKI